MGHQDDKGIIRETEGFDENGVAPSPTPFLSSRRRLLTAGEDESETDMTG